MNMTASEVTTKIAKDAKRCRRDIACGFLVRLRASAAITWESKEALSKAEGAAGLVRAGRARPGSEGRSGPWRVVRPSPREKNPSCSWPAHAFQA